MTSPTISLGEMFTSPTTMLYRNLAAIDNILPLERLWVSDPLLEEISSLEGAELAGTSETRQFDEAGRLNAWCEFHGEDLSEKCARPKVGLFADPIGKGRVFREVHTGPSALP